MVIKFLSGTGSFDGVNYNTNKIDKAKGELMFVSGFGPLQGISDLRPEDYKNYFKMVSARNKAVSCPQFHVAISTKGKQHDKYHLTDIAVQWLAAMGYEKQPYLIVFHKDTGNNHVHIISTRIDKQGKKISSGFEWVRGHSNMNKILGIDEKHSAKVDIEKALTYSFSTKAQYMMILENQGYVVKENGESLDVIKFGIKQDDVLLSQVLNVINNYCLNLERKAQLRAIFKKYTGAYDTTLKPNPVPLPGNKLVPTTGYTSDFASFMREKMGVALCFHAKSGKPPYGYSIIDHSGKMVFKGGEIMPLQELLNTSKRDKIDFDAEQQNKNEFPPAGKISAESKLYYRALLKACMHNYPDLLQGLHHQGLDIRLTSHGYLARDASADVVININELLNGAELNFFEKQLGQGEELVDQVHTQYQPMPEIFIASDVDDEAINGRNRRRKKKARTNTR